MGVTVQGEHDGLEEEDRSDPEGRGAHGPARPDVRSSGEEEHEGPRAWPRQDRVQDVRAESWSAALAGCAAGRCHRRGTCVGRDQARSGNNGTPAPRRRRRRQLPDAPAANAARTLDWTLMTRSRSTWTLRPRFRPLHTGFSRPAAAASLWYSCAGATRPEALA